MYQVIWSREVEGEDFPIHEVVFKGCYDECFAFMVGQAKIGDKVDGWYTLDREETRYE